LKLGQSLRMCWIANERVLILSSRYPNRDLSCHCAEVRHQCIHKNRLICSLLICSAFSPKDSKSICIWDEAVRVMMGRVEGQRLPVKAEDARGLWLEPEGTRVNGVDSFNEEHVRVTMACVEETRVNCEEDSDLANDAVRLRDEVPILGRVFSMSFADVLDLDVLLLLAMCGLEVLIKNCSNHYLCCRRRRGPAQEGQVLQEFEKWCEKRGRAYMYSSLGTGQGIPCPNTLSLRMKSVSEPQNEISSKLDNENLQKECSSSFSCTLISGVCSVASLWQEGDILARRLSSSLFFQKPIRVPRCLTSRRDSLQRARAEGSTYIRYTLW